MSAVGTEDQLHQAAGRAAERARGHLRRARDCVASARSVFRTSPWLFAGGGLDEYLENDTRNCAAAYRELVEALEAADKAISKAESACDGLDHATAG